jgi:ABC-type transport system involved in cytochrome c biogenesis ATPase subunit
MAAPSRISARAEVLDQGVAYIPQGRNIFPELSVRHNLELGGVALTDQASLPGRLEKIMQRFPMLNEKAHAQASTLSGGQQKMLEVARGLLLDPKLILIDEPSIGLSPLMVQEVFAILKSLRDNGVTILLIEQNAKASPADLRLRSGARTGPDAHRRHGAEYSCRPAHRAAVPRRRAGPAGARGMSRRRMLLGTHRREHHGFAVAGTLRLKRSPRPASMASII